MDKNRVFKAKALHYWLNFTERLAEIILHRSPDSYDVMLEMRAVRAGEIQ